MASILIGAGVLTYNEIKTRREKKKAARTQHNESRFAELERDNAARIERLQQQTCFCNESDWTGRGCEIHGTKPHQQDRSGDGALIDQSPESHEPVIGIQAPGNTVEDGRAVLQNGDPVEKIEKEEYKDEETRRINEDRRLRMKSGAFTNWRLRRKGKRDSTSETGDVVVR